MEKPSYKPKQIDNAWRAVWSVFPNNRDQFGPFISEKTAQQVCDRLNPVKKETHTINNIRVHTRSPDRQHFAISEEGCPTCHANKGQSCIDKSIQTHTLLPSHTVHVARVSANGHNVR